MQPLACASFAKRAAVHATSRSSSDVPGCTIVPWSSLANIQYSRRWPVAQRSVTNASVAGGGTTASAEPCGDRQRCRDWVIRDILCESPASDALGPSKEVVSAAIRCGTVSLPKGLWRRSTMNGFTTTALVPDTLTDIGGGACFNDARVQVASLASG